MSKIRTQTQLNEVMTEEFAWRKKELHSLRMLVGTHATHDRMRDLCIRSGLAVLYAHWEGFIKRIGSAYLEFVAQQNVKVKDLQSGFVAIAVKGLLNSATGARRIEPHLAIVDFFRTAGDRPSSIGFKDGLDTESNLNAAVLRNIVLLLGLDYRPFETKEKLIDEKLLKNRNRIAHGEYLTVGVQEYLDLHSEVMTMMQLFFNQVDNAANTNQYKTIPHS
jgi:hypothetical protein